MAKDMVPVRHVPFEDLGLLDQLFRDRSYDVRYLEAGLDRISLESLLEPRIVVVLGGPIGVYDGQMYPFLDDELAAIAARVTAGRPTLGICLGAQLIASAMGAAVLPTGRKEIGFGPLTLTAEGRDSVLSPLDGLPVLHWHGDQFGIPDHAVRLAETPGFPNQAFSGPEAVLALQFHLEADHTRIERWLIGHAHELASAGIDPNRIRADALAHGPALAQAATQVFANWLDRIDPLSF